MNAVSHTPAPLIFQRVPADKVKAFIKAQERSVAVRTEAEDLLARIESDAHQIAAQTQKDLKALEDRIEREAEEIASRSAQKLSVKQDAMNATAALAQVAAIADDYASLETWITKTVMSAVHGILKGIPEEERWAGMIRKALDQTKERWDLSLVCHPADHDTVMSAIQRAEISSAVAHVYRDNTLPEGTCYLKGCEDYFELNLTCQTAALEQEIDACFKAGMRNG